jgi:hypothetical protein
MTWSRYDPEPTLVRQLEVHRAARPGKALRVYHLRDRSIAAGVLT